MSKTTPSIVASRKVSRGGFTLVELLVVIGIIAILAGVALGPITRGIKQAKQSTGMQTSRTIALAEFAFSNDNNQQYPDVSNQGGGSAAGAAAVACGLLLGTYVNDASIFYLSGSSATKYTGNAPSTALTAANVSWDFAGMSTKLGINSNTPDQMPVVWSSVAAGGGTAGTEPTIATAGLLTITPSATNAFGTAGVAVTFKSNSAKFVVSSGTPPVSTLVDTTYPGFSNAQVLSGGG